MKIAHPRTRRPGVSPADALIPMIDVVFLLLVYFLQTHTYNPPESELTPALDVERVAGGIGADYQPLVIEVALFEGRPGFRVGQHVHRDQASLTALLEELPRQGGVFVQGSDALSVSWAAAALQAARDAGFERVTYVPAE